MKKLSLVLLSLLFLQISTSGLNAYENHDKNWSAKYHIRDYYFQPCRSWNYDFNIRGYICGSRAFSIRTPDSYDVERVIADLDKRIKALEKKIEKLEKSNH